MQYFYIKTRLSQVLLPDMELLKKTFLIIQLWKIVTKCKKKNFQNSTEYRTTHFNISVAVICNRDKKDKFAVNLLWLYLLCWFTLVTRFLYYIPATCVTKRLLIFNILCSRFKNMEIWTLNFLIGESDCLYSWALMMTLITFQW